MPGISAGSWSGARAPGVSERACSRPFQRADDVAHFCDRLKFALGQIVGDAGNGRVHFRAAKRLAIDDFVDRGLDDRRAAEMDAAGAAHHHDFVGERRDVGAAGRAAAENRRDLRQARSGHPALLEERAAEMIAIGENPILLGQEGAAAIDQVDARQAVLVRDFLRPKMLLDGLVEERAAFHGGVVGDDHARQAGDDTDRPSRCRQMEPHCHIVPRPRAATVRGTARADRRGGRSVRGPGSCRVRYAGHGAFRRRRQGPGHDDPAAFRATPKIRRPFDRTPTQPVRYFQ